MHRMLTEKRVRVTSIGTHGNGMNTLTGYYALRGFCYTPEGRRVSRLLRAYRLISVSGGTSASSFAYDGLGNRISQKVGSGTYSYVNDQASGLPVVLEEKGPDGDIAYSYGVGLISESSTAFDYFHHHDGLGSVIGLSNSAGTLEQGYAYDAWGNAISSVGSVGTKNKFRFTGEALDPGTQLYYLRACYQDASIGRFVARDPAQSTASRPLSSNKYAYAENNPTDRLDPSGKTPTSSPSEMLGSGSWSLMVRTSPKRETGFFAR
jgi:RHS repeat-associated protein